MLVDDPVKRVDNMTMAWGLEARTPFLDHELVELAAACPPGLKLAHGGKGVLKDAARGVVPDLVIDRPKGYFPVPALSTLEGATLSLVRETLSEDAVRARGLFRPEHVRTLLGAPNDHLTTLEGSKLWQLALLELWLTSHGILSSPAGRSRASYAEDRDARRRAAARYDALLDGARRRRPRRAAARRPWRDHPTTGSPSAATRSSSTRCRG